MLRHHAINLCVTVIPVHIGEHPAFSLFQVRTDAFRNSAQLFASTFFCYPGLSVFDPSIEAKMLTIFEQNNYQLTDEKSREIDARVRRLELEVQPEILDARHVDGGMKDRHDSGRLLKSALGPVVI
jgi:hypothetical protein